MERATDVYKVSDAVEGRDFEEDRNDTSTPFRCVPVPTTDFRGVAETFLKREISPRRISFPKY